MPTMHEDALVLAGEHTRPDVADLIPTPTALSNRRRKPKREMLIRLASFNVNTLNDPADRKQKCHVKRMSGRFLAIRKQALQLRLHALALQETRQPAGTVSSTDYLSFFSGADDNGCYSCAIMLVKRGALAESGSTLNKAELSAGFNLAATQVVHASPTWLYLVTDGSYGPLHVVSFHAPHSYHTAERIAAWWTDFIHMIALMDAPGRKMFFTWRRERCYRILCVCACRLACC